MVYGGGVLALVEVVLLVSCAMDIIRTPKGAVRNLPKLLWLLLVVVLPIVGGIAWLIAGRPQGPLRSLPVRSDRNAGPAPGRPRPPAPLRPDDDEAFLRGLRERVEQQRRAAERQRKAAGDDPVTPG